MKIENRKDNRYNLFEYTYNDYDNSGEIHFLLENDTKQFNMCGSVTGYVFFGFENCNNGFLFEYLGLTHDDVRYIYVEILKIEYSDGGWPYTDTKENLKRVLRFLYENQIDVKNGKLM